MILQSDNGTEFVNAILREVTQKLKIEHRLTTPYHPRANGVAERNMRTLKAMLSKQLEGAQESWDDRLPIIQLQMNAKFGSLHHSTPFSLFFGRSFAGISDFSSARSELLSEKDLLDRIKYLADLVFPAISERSQETQRKMIELFNKTHRIVDYPPGSYVMAKEEVVEGKLDPKYDGPYLVVRRTEFGSYELQDATKEILPRYYAPEQLKLVTQDLDSPNEEEHYEVETILSHRVTSEGMRYLVKWKGYDEDENSELAAENFDSPTLVKKYHKKLQLMNPHAHEKQSRKEQKAQKKAEVRRRTRSEMQKARAAWKKQMFATQSRRIF
jgi:hypothetical protein